MAWRAAVSALVLAATLTPPPASSQTSVALDEVDGCFAPDKAYPRDHLVLTFPVTCLFWARRR